MAYAGVEWKKQAQNTASCWPIVDTDMKFLFRMRSSSSWLPAQLSAYYEELVACQFLQVMCSKPELHALFFHPTAQNSLKERYGNHN